jgi:hypothetical protein
LQARPQHALLVLLLDLLRQGHQREARWAGTD